MLMMGDKFTVVVDGYVFVVSVAVTMVFSLVAKPSNENTPREVRTLVDNTCRIVSETYGFAGLTAQELFYKLVGDAQT